MKQIITAAQSRAADCFTIEKEPIPSIDLMERASSTFVEKFVRLYSEEKKVLILAGTGNNGGDALVIARMLSGKGYEVRVVLVRFSPNLSPDCQVNLDRLNLAYSEINENNYDALSIVEEVVIDGVFGSGLNRPLKGWLAQLVEKVNSALTEIVSIDIPSGLLSDSIDLSGVIFKARHTITFQRLKLTFLFPETGNYCGDLHVVNIGLDEDYIESLPSDYKVLEPSDVQINKREKFAHKGIYGHAQVFAGSKGKMGAAHLSAKAVLKSGVGLCTAHVPACGLDVLQANLPEAMVLTDDHQEIITSGQLLDKVNAVCVGPGIGTEKETKHWFSKFLEELELPTVFDADALNLLAQEPQLLNMLPKGAILTPHLGELARLIGPTQNSLDRFEKVKAITRQYSIYVLIKGAHSAIVTPEGYVIFNSTGNPGMATAGSGDVLSGIIAGFLAQGLSPLKALTTGVYVHGLAGDEAKSELGEASIMASDLLELLPKSITNVTLV